MQLSMFSLAEPPASPIQSQDSERDWTIRVVTSCSPMLQLLGNIAPGGWSGRTSPVCFRAIPDETLAAFWGSSLDSASKSPPPPTDGRTAESYRATTARMVSHGACLTLSTLEYHSAAVASSLSDILETGDVPQEFFLSATACQGILRRAARRGRELPEALGTALKSAAAMLA
jgi:hypothetical protein